MANEVHVGDIGTEFRVQVKDQDGAAVNTTALSAILKIYLIKPNKAVVTLTATPGSTQNPALTGADGWMHHVTTTDIIDKAGTWSLEGYVELDVDKKWTSDISTFEVRKPKWMP